MRKPEQLLWDAMKKNNLNSQEFWLERIENGVGDGIPDVHAVRRKGKEFWVELKVKNAPKLATTPVFGKKGLRTSQLNWHRQYLLMGHKSFILAQVPGIYKGALPADLVLVEGRFADDFNAANKAQLLEMSLPYRTWPQIYNHWRTL